ncbi:MULTISPECIES: glutathione S-transferase N-terminal domain-containing protein [Rhodomicrobium]|uniref:glutathione S-transferase N-terminal domain-containing protein n=1 Tax=Rhodomicrobium TaxID=1068 RepID=UPI000B4B3948|nr:MULTISPECIES: glutathione S-transferase N-terminal domain-containing protein [Rhodomicrobium]
MKLYHSPTSPYARKVRVVILEKALGGFIEEIAVDAYADPAVLTATNPLGKIPALVTDEGLALFDSPVICAYLDAHPKAEGPRLKPQSGPEQWSVARAEALGDGMMDLGLALQMERRKPEGETSPTSARRWRSQMTRALDTLPETLAILPQDVTIGHFAIACALGYLDLRHGDMNWRDGRGELAGWYESIAARPSLAATKPN